MLIVAKHTIIKIILLFLILTLESFNYKHIINDKTSSYNHYYDSPHGLIIDWNKNVKLKQSDFKAKRKATPGFAVATTASAFGYNLVNDNGNISGSIYVRFYCDSSWWNPDYKNSDILDEILEHEQLHFDICEVYGRKLFKEMIALHEAGKLNGINIDRMHARLDMEYSQYQDRYDRETNHSINRQEQEKWNKKVKKELNSLSKYTGYAQFNMDEIR